MTDLSGPPTVLPDDVLARYLAGEGSPADRASIERWAMSNPANVRLLRALEGEWSDREDGPRYDVAAQVTSVLARIGHGTGTSARGSAAAARQFRNPALRARRHWSVGAAALAAAAVVIALVARQVGPFAGLAQPVREFVTPAGGRGTVTLRDGTQLVLGPSTRVRVSADFGRATRTVDLDGEAEFHVVHNADHPFRVRTANAVMRDVGTTFVVRAYGEDAELRVAVLEGEVGVDAPFRGTMQTADLDARSEARIGADGRLVVRRAVSLGADIAWLQGGLAFDATPLREVAREIARTYGVEVAIADTALAGKRITSTFDDETVDEVLDAITQAIGARYERTGRTVTIRPAGIGIHRGRSVGPAATSVQVNRDGQ